MYTSDRKCGENTPWRIPTVFIQVLSFDYEWIKTSNEYVTASANSLLIYNWLYIDQILILQSFEPAAISSPLSGSLEEKSMEFTVLEWQFKMAKGLRVFQLDTRNLQNKIHLFISTISVGVRTSTLSRILRFGRRQSKSQQSVHWKNAPHSGNFLIDVTFSFDGRTSTKMVIIIMKLERCKITTTTRSVYTLK